MLSAYCYHLCCCCISGSLHDLLLCDYHAQVLKGGGNREIVSEPCVSRSTKGNRCNVNSVRHDLQMKRSDCLTTWYRSATSSLPYRRSQTGSRSAYLDMDEIPYWHLRPLVTIYHFARSTCSVPHVPFSMNHMFLH